VDIEEQDLDSVGSPEVSSSSGDKRPYIRPELVHYGALQEVTRAYTQARSCAGGNCTSS
jgi:hypothetical protein